MSIELRQLTSDDISTVQDFIERAFEPIFDGWREVLGEFVFSKAFPNWRALQRGHVSTFFDDSEAHNWLAIVDDMPVGYIVYKLNHETKIGVVDFLVVDPDYHQKGIGTRLNQFALEQLRDAGMEVAEVGTGGDEAHAPARRAYEKIGYVGIPGMYYYKDLRE